MPLWQRRAGGTEAESSIDGGRGCRRVPHRLLLDDNGCHYRSGTIGLAGKCTGIPETAPHEFNSIQIEMQRRQVRRYSGWSHCPFARRRWGDVVYRFVGSASIRTLAEDVYMDDSPRLVNLNWSQNKPNNAYLCRCGCNQR